MLLYCVYSDDSSQYSSNTTKRLVSNLYMISSGRRVMRVGGVGGRQVYDNNKDEKYLYIYVYVYKLLSRLHSIYYRI